MKHTFYILFFFCTWGVSIASNKQIDSLFQIVDKQTGEQKLKTLAHIAEMTNGAKKVDAAVRLRLEADRQSNHLFLAVAYQQAAYYSNEYQMFDSVKWYIDKGLSELEKVNVPTNKYKEDWESYNSIATSLNTSLVKYYIVTDKYYLALNHLQQMLEKNKEEQNELHKSDIYLLMAMVYSYIGLPEEALKYITESVNSVSEKEDRKHTFWVLECYKTLEKYDEILVLGDSIIKLVKEESPISNRKYALVPIYYQTAYASIQKGLLTQARIYLDEIYEETKDNTDEAVNHYLESEYYYKAQDYSRSLSNINVALSLNDQPILNRIALEQTKAKVLRALGRGNEAYDLLDEIRMKNDSINMKRFASQISEFEIIHRVDRLKNDLLLKDSKLHSFRLLLGGSVLITLLVIVVVVVVWRGNKRLRQRNLDLYKRHKKLEELTQGIEETQSQLTAVNDQLDANDIIMNKLDCYMKESKAFLDSEITRDSLAIQIGTNRQYLVTAIKEKRDQTFNEYIYLWRLKHAYNLIIRHRDVPISEIFLESGFSSQSVFNREFKKSYGMTPSELRTAAEEEEKSKNTRE